MSPIVADAIAAELAKLTRVVPEADAELGYGADLSCIADVTPSLDEVDPYSPRGIAEATIRRLTTPRGGLPDDANYGIDLRAYCNRGTTRTELRDLAGIARGEALKDDRLDDAEITITQPDARTLTIDVHLTPADASTAFAFTFRVTSGGAALEELR